MLYLVKMESLDNAVAMIPPAQMPQVLERVVIPTLEIAAKWEAEKKILAGGTVAGTRDGVFIVDAASHSELNELLSSLPLWSMCETTLIPLEGIKAQLAVNRKMLAQLKAQ